MSDVGIAFRHPSVRGGAPRRPEISRVVTETGRLWFTPRNWRENGLTSAATGASEGDGADRRGPNTMTGDRIHVLQTGESDAQSPDVTEVLSAGGFEVTAAEAPASLAESTADCVVAVATDPESATDSPEST
ncbi:MAG: hypothetical protein ABEJ22_04145, partial [Haloferacaceae archaeon]